MENTIVKKARLHHLGRNLSNVALFLGIVLLILSLLRMLSILFTLTVFIVATCLLVLLLIPWLCTAFQLDLSFIWKMYEIGQNGGEFIDSAYVYLSAAGPWLFAAAFLFAAASVPLLLQDKRRATGKIVVASIGLILALIGLIVILVSGGSAA